MKVSNVPYTTYFEKQFSYSFLAFIGILWLSIFFLLPIILLVYISFTAESDTALAVYQTATSGIYLNTILRSFGYGLIATVFCVIFSFITAYYIAFYAKYKKFLLLCVIIPAWIAYVIRYIGIFLLFSGPTEDYLGSDLGMLFSTQGVIFGIVVVLLPFGVLPIFASLSRIDNEVKNAARSMGASELRTIYDIIIPLGKPGILASSVLVFILGSGSFIAPDVLGGPRQTMIANMIGDAFTQLYRIELAAAISTVYTAALLLLIVIFNRYANFEEAFGNL